MSFKNFDVKYNSCDKVLQNYNDFRELKNKGVFAQRVGNGGFETIYAPDFSKYPRYDFENQPQSPNQVLYPQPNQMPNPLPSEPSQIPNQSPNYNLPNQNLNQSPNYNLPNDNFYRNPYVPVGRERISSGYFDTSFERDMALARQLYTGINKALYPIVMEVLNEYEYDGSPIYGEELDRESLAQLVDRVIRRAGELLDDAEEAFLDVGDNISYEYGLEWNRSNMMYAVVESLLINEIFAVRRPNYRKVRSRYRYNNGVYDGINYY